MKCKNCKKEIKLENIEAWQPGAVKYLMVYDEKVDKITYEYAHFEEADEIDYFCSFCGHRLGIDEKDILKKFLKKRR